MMLLFKSAHCVGGKDYKKGVHEVPKEALKDPYLLKLVKMGLVFEAPEVKKNEAPKVSKKLLAALESEAVEEKVEALPVVIIGDVSDDYEESEEDEADEDTEEEAESEEDFLEEPKKKAKKKAKKKSGGR